MHSYSELEEDIRHQCWVFESLEKLRASCDRKLTHLAKRRKCLTCGTFYYPRVAKTRCPECGGKLKSARKVMTCPDCGYKATELGCPGCGDRAHWEAAPRDHEYIRNVVRPELKGREDDAEARLIALVKEHPVWEWARGVKGLGATGVGRMLSCCDIERCTTQSKLFAHYGWGLRRDGTVQRKVRGETLDYDVKAQSIAYTVAVSLEMQAGDRTVTDKRTGETRTVYSEAGKYFQFYEDWKQENRARGLKDGQAVSRAFRDMLQLFLSHFYEVWRRGVGLSYSEPYPYTVLRPPHSPETKISPWDMVQKAK